MENKITELTQKLFQEGVEKGELEAKEIIDRAKSDATQITAEAEESAKHIIEKAEKAAAELRRNVESEIRLAASRALSQFKQVVLSTVMAKVVDDTVIKTLKDKATVVELVKVIAENWNSASGETPNLSCTLPEAKNADLDRALRKALSDELKKGIDLRFSDSLKSGFRIGPKDGSFAVSFTDGAFTEFFGQHLRPKAKKYLFGE
jgi:V/A-type H+-transporting ATPase subunit E